MAKIKTKDEVVAAFKELDLHSQVDAFKDIREEMEAQKKARENDLAKLKEVEE